MALAHWQRTFTDTAGNIQSGLQITVRDESSGAIASIYEDSAGSTVKSNPFTTDSFGYADFYANDGRYRIQATDIDWRNEEVITFENLQQAVTDAQEARDAAAVNGNIYTDTTTGLANTNDGDYFSTPAAGSDDYLTLYRNDLGTATEIDTYPNSTAIDNVITGLDERTKYIATLTDLEGETAVTSGQVIYLAGRTTAGDGGEGEFRWDGSDLSSTLVLASVTSTSVDSGTDTITSAGHGLVNGNGVVTTTAVNGLTANQVYWVVNATTDTFQLSATVGGAAVDLTGTANFTVEHLLDPLKDFYVSSDPAGASGAWVRQSPLPAKFLRPYQGQEVDILIVYGQSNARGYAANTAGVPEYKVPFARVWNGTSFEEITSYTPTANDGTSTGSAWLAFANEYCKETSRRLVVLNAARGSQTISDLQKGGTNYTALTGWVDSAKGAISSEGSAIGKIFVCFNQGESDSQLSTAPATYSNLLSQLWTDIKADFSAELLAIFTVGYYSNTDMIHGQAIQEAQRSFARSEDDVILAYDELGCFGANNGLKVDSVHYNQRGYNIMGREGSKRVVSHLFDDTGAPVSNEIIQQFGNINVNQTQAWNMHSAVIRKIADGDWRIGTGIPYASSLVLSANALSDRLQLKLACPASALISAFTYINGAGGTTNFRAVIGDNFNWASTIAGSTDADGYAYVDIFFYVDIYLRVDLVSQTVTASEMGSVVNGVLGDISATFPSTGRCDISHPRIYGLPQGSISGATARSLRVNPSSTIETILQLRDSADSLVNDSVTVALPNVKVPPSAIADLTDVSFQLISSDYVAY